MNEIDINETKVPWHVQTKATYFPWTTKLPTNQSQYSSQDPNSEIHNIKYKLKFKNKGTRKENSRAQKPRENGGRKLQVFIGARNVNGKFWG